MTAVLRDYKQENVDAATRLAAEFGLTNVTVELGDAFDRASIAALDPRPTIAIVSGLFELFPGKRGRARIIARIGGSDRTRRLSHLHESALASAGGIYRARPAQPRRRAVDHAPAHHRRDGRARAASPDSRKRKWRWTSGECSRFPSRGVGVRMALMEQVENIERPAALAAGTRFMRSSRRPSDSRCCS